MNIVNTKSRGKHWLRVCLYPCPIRGKSKTLFDLSALSNEIPEIDCSSTNDKADATLEAKGKEKKTFYETN